MRTKIDAWIISNHHVLHSPISKDTQLIYNTASTGEFIRKSKLILQTSVRELLCDLYKEEIGMLQDVINKQGKRLISDTMFRALLPPELRMMINYYKQICMCELCQRSTYMQSALNTFRRNHLSQLEKEYQNYSALSSHEKDAKSILLA